MLQTEPGTQWIEILQTVNLSTPVHQYATHLTALIILVVTKSGLISIYKPGTETEIDQTWTNIELTYHQSLELAEITWLPKSNQSIYNLVWKIAERVQSGNLISNKTDIILKLLPDTSYFFQVAEVNSQKKSKVLYLSTAVDESEKIVNSLDLPPQEIMRMEIVKLKDKGVNGLRLAEMVRAVRYQDDILELEHLQLFAGIAAVMLLACLMVLVWWCRWGRSEFEKKVREQSLEQARGN